MTEEQREAIVEGLRLVDYQEHQWNVTLGGIVLYDKRTGLERKVTDEAAVNRLEVAFNASSARFEYVKLDMQQYEDNLDRIQAILEELQE